MGSRRRVCAAAFGLFLFANDARAQQCTNACEGEGGYYAPHEDREKLARETDPILRELRACLDSAGGRAVSPAVVMRFDSDGKVSNARVEASGYESLPCVAQATAKLHKITLGRETSVRCACGLKSAPPPAPPPPPIVTPPPPPPPQITVVPPTAPPPQYPQYPQYQYPPRPEQPPVYPYRGRTENVWYGWQTLAVDAGSLGLGGIAIAADSSEAGIFSLIGFVIGAPIVHFVHANVGPGFRSMGFRLLLPMAGMGIGAIVGLGYRGGINNGTGDFDDAFGRANTVVNGAVVGAFIGMGLCVILDAAALGWEKKELDTTSGKTLAPQTRVAVSPFGIAGTF